MCGILFELDNPCLLSSNLFYCDSFFYIICFPYGPLRKGTSLKANMMPTREWRHPLFSTVSTEDLKVRSVQEWLDHFVLNFQVKNFPLLKLDPNKSVPGVGGGKWRVLHSHHWRLADFSHFYSTCFMHTFPMLRIYSVLGSLRDTDINQT